MFRKAVLTAAFVVASFSLLAASQADARGMRNYSSAPFRAHYEHAHHQHAFGGPAYIRGYHGHAWGHGGFYFS